MLGVADGDGATTILEVEDELLECGIELAADTPDCNPTVLVVNTLLPVSSKELEASTCAKPDNEVLEAPIWDTTLDKVEVAVARDKFCLFEILGVATSGENLLDEAI